MKPLRKIKFLARDLVYPGLDLNTRNRASLCRFWRMGPRDVLDAGSGNGYFSWLAYKAGANVVALNFEPGQVEKARAYFLEHWKADPARLSFEQRNLYDLSNEQRTFDEILCYETLEHVQRDKEVLTEFYRLLRPGGALHLCCPNRLHPRHQAEVLDLGESGGHVRSGYTSDDYRNLLEPLGFTLEEFAGIGPKSLYLADTVLRKIRVTVGDVPALPLLPLGLLVLKCARINPPVPYSVYVKAVKPLESSRSTTNALAAHAGALSFE